MKKIKGPAIFLAQFVGDDEPFNNLKNISSWVSNLGYKGVQIPSWDNRLIDLDKAAESKDYCDDLRGILDENNIVISELSTHLQGQLVAVHPTYDIQFDGFAPDSVKTSDIYKGVIPFILIQMMMLMLLSVFPGIATWLPAFIFN